MVNSGEFHSAAGEQAGVPQSKLSLVYIKADSSVSLEPREVIRSILECHLVLETPAHDLQVNQRSQLGEVLFLPTLGSPNSA